MCQLFVDGPNLVLTSENGSDFGYEPKCTLPQGTHHFFFACPTENGKTSPLSNLTEFKIKTFEKLVFHVVSDESRLFTWGELLFYLS